MGATLVNFLLVIYGAVQRGTRSSSYYLSETLTTVLVSSAFLTVVVIIALVLFEIMRKRGDALFQELSNDLQDGKEGAGPLEERAPLEFRITLRSFAAAADLPLFPGRMGAALYTGLNMVFVVICLQLVLWGD
ncbi:hypothetical protein Q9R29_01590 [Rothia sp. ARF10]|nr:hypothetical protein [Rothia sp. ARF10]